MRATIKSVEFIEENEKKEFLVKLDTEDGEKLLAVLLDQLVLENYFLDF